MSKDVYIVHCIDTEGPLYESIDASFDRLKEIFGIELEPSIDNLRRIQNKELDLNKPKKVWDDESLEWYDGTRTQQKLYDYELVC